ncbi:MAG: hypothetical protein AAF357_09190 [Verrucomicrobiota bacterium]
MHPSKAYREGLIIGGYVVGRLAPTATIGVESIAPKSKTTPHEAAVHEQRRPNKVEATLPVCAGLIEHKSSSQKKKDSTALLG